MDDLSAFRNLLYDSSKFALEGATFVMYSREQMNEGKGVPVAFLGGISWLGWNKSNGLEAIFKTKVMDVIPAPGASVQPIDLEGRYLHRWTLPFDPFSSLGKSQIAAIAGYEVYRNPTSGVFSPGYNLFKIGFGLEFPFSHTWDTGGEVLYGYGLDQSTKYEISGHLNYYIVKDWTMGVGYRIHLFQAGSTASAPADFGIPYREGYGEGYSELSWRY